MTSALWVRVMRPWETSFRDITSTGDSYIVMSNLELEEAIDGKTRSSFDVQGSENMSIVFPFGSQIQLGLTQSGYRRPPYFEGRILTDLSHFTGKTSGQVFKIECSGPMDQWDKIFTKESFIENDAASMLLFLNSYVQENSTRMRLAYHHPIKVTDVKVEKGMSVLDVIKKILEDRNLIMIEDRQIRYPHIVTRFLNTGAVLSIEIEPNIATEDALFEIDDSEIIKLESEAAPHTFSEGVAQSSQSYAKISNISKKKAVGVSQKLFKNDDESRFHEAYLNALMTATFMPNLAKRYSVEVVHGLHIGLNSVIHLSSEALNLDEKLVVLGKTIKADSTIHCTLDLGFNSHEIEDYIK